MNTQSNLIIGSEATEKMFSGIETATSAIRLSYGAKGVNAIIEQEFEPYHIVANDCETILQSIHVNDKYEKIGLDILKELSSKANKDSGDGRKTTCILAEEIIKEGNKSSIKGIDLKNKLDELIPVVEKAIDEQKRVIDIDDVQYVATIAGESPEIGKILRDIYKNIGKDGIIYPEASGTSETTTTFFDGVRFSDTGFLSKYLVNGDEKGKAVYKKPNILVTKRKIESIDDINPLLKTLNTPRADRTKDLVIFTHDMDSGVASALIKAHREGIFKVLIIKAPVLWRDYVFEDFAKVTGSTIVEDASGVTFKNLALNHLGTCDKITVDEEETLIEGGSDIKEHIDYLTKKGDNDSKLRLSWLKTKSCILRLGANNESELSYRRLKCYDAINASKLALRDGIVAGGGVSLLNASNCLPQTPVGELLKHALSEPYRQILKNSGISIEKQDDVSTMGKDIGYNCITGEMCNMYDNNIVDASAVVKNAVRNAISLASTVLTGQILIRFPDKSPEQIAAEALKGKGLRF